MQEKYIKSLWVCEENLYDPKNKKFKNELLNNILLAELLGKYIKSLWICEENLYEEQKERKSDNGERSVWFIVIVWPLVPHCFKAKRRVPRYS